MELNDRLKTAIIEDLKQVEIIFLDYYARENKEILNFLYNHCIIDDTSIEFALEEAVFNQARKDYIMMTSEGRPYTIWADHVGRPDCLAYSLDKGKFSKREIEKIP